MCGQIGESNYLVHCILGKCFTYQRHEQQTKPASVHASHPIVDNIHADICVSSRGGLCFIADAIVDAAAGGVHAAVACEADQRGGLTLLRAPIPRDWTITVGEGEGAGRGERGHAVWLEDTGVCKDKKSTSAQDAQRKRLRLGKNTHTHTHSCWCGKLTYCSRCFFVSSFAKAASKIKAAPHGGRISQKLHRNVSREIANGTSRFHRSTGQ